MLTQKPLTRSTPILISFESVLTFGTAWLIRFAALALFIWYLARPVTHADAQTIKSISRVSINSNGRPSGGKRLDPNLNFDGTVITFVRGEKNANGQFVEDPKVRNRLAGTTEAIAVSPAGDPANRSKLIRNGIFDSSAKPNLNAEGTLVTFGSVASNLVPEDRNQYEDIFLRDLGTAQTTRLSTSLEGVEGDSLSVNPRISANGEFVVFSSYAGNLVPGDSDDDFLDVYIRNLRTGEVSKLPNPGTTAFNPSLSEDGRFVVYQVIFAANPRLYYPFLYDRQMDTLVSVSDNHSSISQEISEDGRFVVFQSRENIFESPHIGPKRNNTDQVYLFSRETAEVSLLSIGVDGKPGNGHSGRPDISADGRFVSYISIASNLVENDTNRQNDIFVLDRNSGKVLRANLTSRCKQSQVAESDSFNTGQPVLSGNGKYVAFTTSNRLLTRPVRIDGFFQSADRDILEDVYLVELDFDTPLSRFDPNAIADSPRVTSNCNASTITVTFPDLIDETDEGEDSLAARRKGGRGSTEEVTRRIIVRAVRGVGEKFSQRKLTSKRNELTLKNLPTGTYSVRYRNEKRVGREIVVSGFSNEVPFTVSR